MSLPRSVADVLKSHVTLEVEGIDRMYLNVYQPRLQNDRGVALFFRFYRGEIFASSALMNPMSKSFIAAVDCFVSREQVPLITFTKGQRNHAPNNVANWLVRGVRQKGADSPDKRCGPPPRRSRPS